MLCRLCVKESLCFLNIFDSDGIKMDIADILGRHFWFKPLVDDGMSPAICTMCWAKVYNFHQFYVTIEQAHSMLSASNVEKAFVLEYVGNEFVDNDVVGEELSVTLCSTIEEEKEFVDPDFIEIDDSAKKLAETPCPRIGNRNESMDQEFIKIDVNAKEFPEDPCPNTSIQKEQNNLFTKLVPGIDIRGGLNETCDKLNNEDLEYLDNSADDSCSGCGAPETAPLIKKSLKAGKNRKTVTTTEKKMPKLRKTRIVNTECKERNKISSDRCNAQDPPLTTNFMEPVKKRKRITTSKKGLPQLREKRSLNEIFADFSNHETLDTALDNSTESFNDSSLSDCDPLEPELQKFAIPKSTESVKDASLSNDDTHELAVKSKISAKNRKKLASTEEKLAILREKRGIKAMCNDDELVKKYIPMRCDVCIFYCDEFETLKNHYRLDHPNIKPYVKCCNRKWYSWLSIVHHTYRHDDPEFFKCQECQRICTDQGTLSLHMIDFHAPEEDKIFNCDLCPKKFARKKRLEIHRNLHIPMNERTFICDQCPTSRFSSDALLRVHIRNTHRRASLVCHVCAKKIKTKGLFEKHVRLHFEESGPRVKCTFEGCDSWLKDEDNLRLHIRRFHNKNIEKKFTCDICGGEYKSRASFTDHMRRVHPKKTFPCEICNKSFKTGLNLREHMAQHTGEKNYQCRFCTSTFNVTGNYYSHLKRHHSVEYENWRKDNLTANIRKLSEI